METRLLLRVDSQTSFPKISLYGSVWLYEQENIQGEAMTLRPHGSRQCIFTLSSTQLA